MSIQNALTFIREVDSTIEFRKSFYPCKTKSELLAKLTEQGLSFTSDEFEDAINNLLLKCQTYEQADHVRELHVWFLLFKD